MYVNITPSGYKSLNILLSKRDLIFETLLMRRFMTEMRENIYSAKSLSHPATGRKNISKV